MTRVLFLSSGGGGNFQFVQDCVATGILPNDTVLSVVSDRDSALLARCRARGIDAEVSDFTMAQQEGTLLPVLEKLAPDFIVTTVTRVISPKITQRFQNNMINLHYSLLPAFARTVGFSALQSALSSGQKFCGATVHYVTEDVDAGRQIAQAAIPILDSDRHIDDLADIVFRSGALLLACAVSALVFGRRECADVFLPVCNRNVVLNTPCANLALAANDEPRWSRVKISCNS